MSATLITNIGELTTNVGRDGDAYGTLHDAAVLIEGDRIAWVGPARGLGTGAGLGLGPGFGRGLGPGSAPDPDGDPDPDPDPDPDRESAAGGRGVGNLPTSRPGDALSRGVEVVDAGGRAVIPGFVDSHTHLVFGGDRADEFEARMTGTPYAAGGIQRTVAATRAATDEQLRARLRDFVAELHAQGTTTFEVKTGYGLTVADEERLARLAAEVTPEVTFLGAHVVPAEYAERRDEYVDLVCDEMLRAAAPHARWIDVFCERGAFTPEESRRVLAAGAAHGLAPRVHGNQLGHGEGVRIAVAMDAASVDHCTYLDDDDVAALAGSGTVATLLPGVEFSTRQPYPDARRLIDAGVTVALASDCNPGSSFTSSMPLMIALAVREMGMTPAEAVWAATAGGARALRRSDIGAVAPGMRADLVLLDAPTRVHLAYRPGVPLVRDVWVAGRRL
ncbi:imidazolonepropionase [Microbacterium cremeum]|uniref:imidazolonepropionase n=1 Tax=Microbacterium cremeum TaxID=2782169 RepID=UPI001E58E7D4|nr:imidazolonepropionase [Microbacterium cremeum]